MHSEVTTAARIADCHVLPALPPGKDYRMWSDPGYQGQLSSISQSPLKASEMKCKPT